MALSFGSGSSRPPLLNFKVDSKAQLYAAYMSFLQNGGLFIPSVDEFHLGDQVFILLAFTDTGERMSVPGRVAWITPRRAPGKRPQGVGVQFQPPQAAEVQRKIEAMLAGHDVNEPTLTL